MRATVGENTNNVFVTLSPEYTDVSNVMNVAEIQYCDNTSFSNSICEDSGEHRVSRVL